jgi:hypothetical protein
VIDSEMKKKQRGARRDAEDQSARTSRVPLI